MPSVSLPAIAAGAGIVGAGTSAVGAIEGGAATANAANYSAQVARNNATIANQNALYASAAGAQQTAEQSQKGAAQIGGIIAAQAANGVDVNTGSNKDVQISQRGENELSAENTSNNAALQAYGYRTQQTSFEAQAGLDEETAEQAPIGAALTAGGGLLSSASALGLKAGGGLSFGSVTGLPSSGLFPGGI
jgi:hypothetical protein